MANEYTSVFKYRIALGRIEPRRMEEVGGTKLTFLFTAGYIVPQGSGRYMVKSGSEQ